MGRRLVVLVALPAALSAAAMGAAFPGTTGSGRPVVVPRPTFPPPLLSARPGSGTKLRLLSSRARSPVLTRLGSTPSWPPRRFQDGDLLQVITQPGLVFLVYGQDGTTARFVVVANARTHAVVRAFDFAAFARPPQRVDADAGLVYEQVVWVRAADGVLYVETAHQTYAASSKGRNGYVTAVVLRTGAILWRSPALVANAGTFVLAGDSLVTGYGFTREPDYLYLLDRRTGRVQDQLLLPSAPERIVRHGNRLTVQTYDHDVVAELRAS